MVCICPPFFKKKRAKNKDQYCEMSSRSFTVTSFAPINTLRALHNSIAYDPLPMLIRSEIVVVQRQLPDILSLFLDICHFLCHIPSKFMHPGGSMAFKKMETNFSFADISMISSFERNRAFNRMKQIDTIVDWSKIENLLLKTIPSVKALRVAWLIPLSSLGDAGQPAFASH